ncbi:MAG: 3-dehydroquinate synthase [Lachnospiraceae bacterium]|nr:3-dehydroquinate synthase [Lachnospiraceae bacterium]
MSDRLTVKAGNKEYDIFLERDFRALPDAVEKAGLSGRRLCIVTDSNVEKLYAKEVSGLLSGIAQSVHIFSFPAGEENKTLDTVRELYAFLIEKHFERRDVLVALGGGVVGDLAGFAAATFLRGIDFIQVPTTLLSCTDSSIGGKTGVDFDQYKNMVGAFHSPRLVYMNLAALSTLTARQFASGMGEVLKHGLIRNESFYEFLVNHFSEINDRELDVLIPMVRQSLEIKKDVVEKDPTEKGERAILNFGHTIGHAIEKYMGLKLMHGECVALGSIAACYISYRRGYLSTEEYYEIRDMFLPFFLPITLPDEADAAEILRLTKSDKKMNSGKIRFILLKKVGEAYIDTEVSDEEMLSGIQELILKDE